jgi:hypothetical protein
VRRGGINREGLAALLPVPDDRREELGRALGAMPAGQASPLARIGATHFARLVVLDEFPGRNGGKLSGMPACLFFGAEFDIPVAGYLEALCTRLPEEADAVFRTCAGYPGVSVPPLFSKWMLRHRIKAGFSLHGNPQVGVREVVESLRLRARIIEFALETRTLAPAALKEAWDSQNWGTAA